VNEIDRSHLITLATNLLRSKTAWIDIKTSVKHAASSMPGADSLSDVEVGEILRAAKRRLEGPHKHASVGRASEEPIDTAKDSGLSGYPETSSPGTDSE